MIKLLFKLIVILAIGILSYNFFFGSPEEQEASRRVVTQVRDLGASVFDLLRSEKEKFNQGKYDQALGKVKAAIGLEKERATELGSEGQQYFQEVEYMQQEEFDIEQRLSEFASNTGLTPEEQAAGMRAIRERILTLTNQTQGFADRMR